MIAIIISEILTIVVIFFITRDIVKRSINNTRKFEKVCDRVHETLGSIEIENARTRELNMELDEIIKATKIAKQNVLQSNELINESEGDLQELQEIQSKKEVITFHADEDPMDEDQLAEENIPTIPSPLVYSMKYTDGTADYVKYTKNKEMYLSFIEYYYAIGAESRVLTVEEFMDWFRSFQDKYPDDFEGLIMYDNVECND